MEHLRQKLLFRWENYSTIVFLLKKFYLLLQLNGFADFKSPIFIQQDNAKTNVDPNDEKFRQTASQYGFDIRLKCHPANSPNLIVLDLGFLVLFNHCYGAPELGVIFTQKKMEQKVDTSSLCP